MGSRPDFSGRTSGRPYASLRGHDQFRRTYRTGTRRRCGAITVVISAGPPGPPVVGFVAGKRVGSAVARNRAKRRLREAASYSRLKPDTVYVLVADQGVLTADFDRLVRWISRCAELSDAAEEAE